MKRRTEKSVLSKGNRLPKQTLGSACRHHLEKMVHTLTQGEPMSSHGVSNFDYKGIEKSEDAAVNTELSSSYSIRVIERVRRRLYTVESKGHTDNMKEICLQLNEEASLMKKRVQYPFYTLSGVVINALGDTWS